MSALPLALPRLSAGFAALGPPARELGKRVARAVEAALTAQLGFPVTIDGQPLPSPPETHAAVLELPLVLEQLPGHARLELDVALAAALVQALSGEAPSHAVAGLHATRLEQAAAELATLVALRAACALDEVRAAEPRLARGGGEVERAVAVALRIRVGAVDGSARLLLPAAALPACDGEAGGAAPLTLAWLRHTARLDATDLAALAPGDVLVLDAAEEAPPDALLVPGGALLRGRVEDERFTLEDVCMSEWNGRLPVTVSVEIARVTVAIGALARLEPGGALPLQVAKDGAVVLRAGDVPLARGTLVDLDGALGVRITSLEVLP